MRRESGGREMGFLRRRRENGGSAGDRSGWRGEPAAEITLSERRENRRRCRLGGYN